jgi:hypothetical protein
MDTYYLPRVYYDVVYLEVDGEKYTYSNSPGPGGIVSERWWKGHIDKPNGAISTNAPLA